MSGRDSAISRSRPLETADIRDAAKFARRLGFSQIEFAERIDVSLDTIRNWEQGKSCPIGAAKALLKVLEAALAGCSDFASKDALGSFVDSSSLI